MTYFFLLSLNDFWKKYIDVIQLTSYSKVLFDIQKGIEALSTLVNFFSENLNGGS
jgi:hypothetical protein